MIVSITSEGIEALVAAGLESGQDYWKLVGTVREEMAWCLRDSADSVDSALASLAEQGHGKASAMKAERDFNAKLLESQRAELMRMLKGMKS